MNTDGHRRTYLCLSAFIGGSFPCYLAFFVYLSFPPSFHKLASLRK